jgi:hypothetical protein
LGGYVVNAAPRKFDASRVGGRKITPTISPSNWMAPLAIPATPAGS